MNDRIGELPVQQYPAGKMEEEIGYTLPKPNDALWQFAFENAISVRDALVRAVQQIEQDKQVAAASVNDALGALANLRARAPEASALLAAVLFFGIELEVRLTGAIAGGDNELEQALGGEIERTEKLIAAIRRHMKNT